ncbi:hypothetical protein ASC80_05765 [Afipia sp. Root123D2]|uniref:hypothetical protein n=1 Tax=Afipia sp. Root123D2 TaxID=1736436 RepID=UPI0006FC8FE3|nr:hypothetical protein [Afipia sp. Root123D2]KQW22847.1 hypothetical protein ASC80_05765 [Afipia sp. Root123D2]
MTALNIIQFPGVFYMFCDTAVYDKSAVVTQFKPKIYPVPTARSAIGHSGSGDLGRLVSLSVQGARSIRELLADTKRAAKFYIEQGLLSGYGPYQHKFFVAGFSDEGEQQFWIMDFRPTVDDVPDFKRVDPPWGSIQPLIQLDYAEDEVGANPDRFCRMVLERQRALPVITEHWNDGTPSYVVGGAGILVTVTPDTITRKVIASWPDVVGQRINAKAPARDVGAAFPGYALDTTNGLVKPTSTTGTLISSATGTLITNTTTRTSAIFDDVTDQPSSAAAQKASATSFYAGKTYLGGKAIGKAIVYGTNNIGFVSGTPSITINLRGKNGTAPSSASDGTLLGTLTFTGTSDESAGRTVNSSDTTTAYDHVFVEVTQSGSAGTMCLAEVQFYAPGTTSNMTVVTTAQTADASVENASCLIEYDNTAAPTLNTDLTVELSCDGGSTWSTTTLTLLTAYGQGGRSMAKTDDVACTAGTSYTARIKTLNNKMIEIYGVAISVH